MGLKLRWFHAHVDIAKPKFRRPRASDLASTSSHSSTVSVNGFFVQRNFESVEDCTESRVARSDARNTVAWMHENAGGVTAIRSKTGASGGETKASGPSSAGKRSVRCDEKVTLGTEGRQKGEVIGRPKVGEGERETKLEEENQHCGAAKVGTKTAKQDQRAAKKEKAKKEYIKKQDQKASKIADAAEKPNKLPKVDPNAPSARNPLLRYNGEGKGAGQTVVAIREPRREGRQAAPKSALVRVVSGTYGELGSEEEFEA